MPSAFATELYGLYDPQDDFELKLYLMDLAARVAEIEQMDPQTPKASHGLTSAMYTHFCELKKYVEDVSQRLGINTAATITSVADDGTTEQIPVYDFTCLTYAEFEALVQQILQDLPAEIETWIPSWFVVWSDDEKDTARWVLAKILAALGVNEAYQAFLEVLEELAPDLLEQLAKAIKARNWSAVRRLLRQLLNLIVSKRFFNALASRIGTAAARRIIGNIMARMIPGIGWGLLIAALLWAFAEEYI